MNIKREDELKQDFYTWHRCMKYEPTLESIAQYWIHQVIDKELHKIYLCAIGKYSGDPLENVKDEISEYLRGVADGERKQLCNCTIPGDDQSIHCQLCGKPTERRLKQKDEFIASQLDGERNAKKVDNSS